MKKILLISLLSLLCGCQQKVSLDTWKQSVEHYVWDQANGDPTSLRDLPTQGPWKGYAVISDNGPDSSTDINGLLLGHRQVGPNPYFIFLVGIVEKQQVADIRLAALRPSPSGFQWRITEKNQQAFDAYHHFHDSAWRALYPNRATGPWAHTSFPCEADNFKLSITGQRVAVTHEQSGANWSLDVPPESPTTAPSVAGSD
jgi:hypothetical protein